MGRANVAPRMLVRKGRKVVLVAADLGHKSKSPSGQGSLWLKVNIYQYEAAPPVVKGAPRGNL